MELMKIIYKLFFLKLIFQLNMIKLLNEIKNLKMEKLMVRKDYEKIFQFNNLINNIFLIKILEKIMMKIKI